MKSEATLLLVFMKNTIDYILGLQLQIRPTVCVSKVTDNKQTQLVWSCSYTTFYMFFTSY